MMIKHNHIFKILLFMALFFVGEASAFPTKITDRSEYSTALNSVASLMMNWYGSLISENKDTNKKIVFDTINIDEELKSYRSQYPKNISQIIITDTELLRLDTKSSYLFKVSSNFTYQIKKKTQVKSIVESFIISNNLLTQSNSFPIKSIHRDTIKDTTSLGFSKFDRFHYKVREFTYAWLAYMDGNTNLMKSMNAKAWIMTSPFDLKMGNINSETSVSEALNIRQKLLTKGGHLLRSLDVIPDKHHSNTFVIDLILEWKGNNASGKPVIARINQKIKIKIKADNTWEVISIKEKHLLPIIAPWMGLVC